MFVLVKTYFINISVIYLVLEIIMMKKEKVSFSFIDQFPNVDFFLVEFFVEHEVDFFVFLFFKL